MFEVGQIVKLSLIGIRSMLHEERIGEDYKTPIIVKIIEKELNGYYCEFPQKLHGALEEFKGMLFEDEIEAI